MLLVLPVVVLVVLVVVWVVWWHGGGWRRSLMVMMMVITSEARNLNCRQHKGSKQKIPGPRPKQDEGSSALDCSRTLGPSTLNGLGLRV